MKVLLSLWSKFCLSRAEHHRDECWEHKCWLYSGQGRYFHQPLHCPQCNAIIDIHIKSRNLWYARHDKAQTRLATPPVTQGE